MTILNTLSVKSGTKIMVQLIIDGDLNLMYIVINCLVKSSIWDMYFSRDSTMWLCSSRNISYITFLEQIRYNE